MENKYGKQIENIFDKDTLPYLDDIALSDYHNFKLQKLAEKIKSQTIYRPKPKMIYY